MLGDAYCICLAFLKGPHMDEFIWDSEEIRREDQDAKSIVELPGTIETQKEIHRTVLRIETFSLAQKLMTSCK